MAFTIIDGGTFTSDGLARKINLPSSADYMQVTNTTTWALTTNVGVKYEWYRGVVAAGNSLETYRTSSSTIHVRTFTTAGFTYVTTAPVVEAQGANAITAITDNTPAVVTQTNTYSDGDILQFYGTTGMLQIAGMNFQISSNNGSAYTLLGLAANGFAAPATAGFTRRISPMLAVEPQFLYVTAISQAINAVVTTSVDPTAYYVVGMKVRFSVPSSFGMTQINGLTGKIISMDSATYTMTVDIDSTAFTAFAFPASTASPGAQLFATIAPAGASTQFNPLTNVQTGYDFQFQPFRTGQFTPYMYLSAGVHGPAGADGDVMVWQAFKYEAS